MLVACLVVEMIHSTRNLCIRRPTMTLCQGQGHRKEHEQIYHASVYRHAKFECHSIYTARDLSISIIVQVKHVSSLRRNCDLE